MSTNQDSQQEAGPVDSSGYADFQSRIDHKRNLLGSDVDEWIGMYLIALDRSIELERDAKLGRAIRPYFKSGNSIAVERATILRKDIAGFLDT